jgi:hypothetical protein
MLLRRHPEMAPWIPQHKISLSPSSPRPKNLSQLVVENVLYKSSSTIEFILNGTDTGDLTIEFEDDMFALAVYHSRKRCIGLSLKEAGDVNIE